MIYLGVFPLQQLDCLLMTDLIWFQIKFHSADLISLQKDLDALQDWEANLAKWLV